MTPTSCTMADIWTCLWGWVCRTLRIPPLYCSRLAVLMWQRWLFGNRWALWKFYYPPPPLLILSNEVAGLQDGSIFPQVRAYVTTDEELLYLWDFLIFSREIFFGIDNNGLMRILWWSLGVCHLCSGTDLTAVMIGSCNLIISLRLYISIISISMVYRYS